MPRGLEVQRLITTEWAELLSLKKPPSENPRNWPWEHTANVPEPEGLRCHVRGISHRSVYEAASPQARLHYLKL